MDFRDLQTIELNDIGSWPMWLKAFGSLLICGGIAFAGYWFIIKGQIEELKRAERSEQALKQTFLEKKALAVNLPAYRKQMEEIEESFGVLLRQLPNKTEVPELLVDITQAGLGRGLQFNQFQPQNKRNADFYAILPIKLQVSGEYHELAEFVSDLAALPRIVTLGDISIVPPKGRGRDEGTASLTMTATAQTYHYLDDVESQAKQAAPSKKTRTTRK